MKTKSGKFAIQVVSKHHGKLTVHKHIGSYQTEREKIQLIFEANLFIRDHDNIQQNIFERDESFIHPEDIKITQSRPLFLYRLLCRIFDKLGFDVLSD
ncbi:MAG: hypothetical protein AAB242_11760, partial [Nitrospirota bacterium]